jgi:hypothetical protein
MKQLDKETQESEAQMLCTMLSTAVQDELTYASWAVLEDTTPNVGKFLSFAKEGKTEKVGFYIGAQTDGDSDVSYYPITDSETQAKSYLGKIYRASKDGTGQVTDAESLVSDGAYNVKNATYGNLQAGMQIKTILDPTDPTVITGYEVIVEVYNGLETPQLLASKDFYVGTISESANPDIVPYNSVKYTITFDANGGIFADDNSTQKIFENLPKDSVFTNIPIPPIKNGVTFLGWSPSITGGMIEVTGDLTYRAIWSSYTARFYQYQTDITTGRQPITTVSADSNGRIIGGMSNGQTIDWPGFGYDTYNAGRLQRNYFTHVGWEDSKGNKYYPANNDTWAFNRDENFVAVYEPITYTLEFYNGSTKVATRTATYDPSSHNFMFDTLDIATPVHGDSATWVFKDWYVDREHPASLNSAKTAIPESLIGETVRNSTNNTIKLYAGYQNLTAMYYKMDRLVDGNKVLIVGGDLSSNTQSVMVRYDHVLSRDGIKDQAITTMGNAYDSYVLNSAGPGEDGEFYVDAGSYSGRHYISMKVGSSTVYLDLEFATNKIQLKGSTDVRQWIYNESGHELNGYWRGYFLGLPVQESDYIYFDGGTFEPSEYSHSNGQTHIYEYKNIGEALSFNGIEP